MAVEKDQSAWLPEPPPPRPARRDATIEAALRKFDRIEDAAPARGREPRRSWASSHRPAVAVLVSATLLVVVGIPAALIGIRNVPPPTATAPQAVVPDNVSNQNLPAREVQRAPPALAPSAQAPKKAPAPATQLQVAADVPPTEREAVRQEAPPVREMEAPAAPMAAAAPPAPPPPPPPPPPPVARGERDTGTSDNVIVSGTRMQKPALAAPNAFEAKTAAAQPYAPFLSRLQAAVKANDRRALVRLIDFPLRVNFAGGARTYRDAASADRDFDRIFTAKVRSAVLRQRPDKLFVRDQGAMVGDGELWFRETCSNSSCSPPGPVRIVAINP